MVLLLAMVGAESGKQKWPTDPLLFPSFVLSEEEVGRWVGGDEVGASYLNASSVVNETRKISSTRRPIHSMPFFFMSKTTRLLRAFRVCLSPINDMQYFLLCEHV